MIDEPARLRLAGTPDVPAAARLEHACFPDPWRADELAVLLGSGAIEIALLEERGEALAYAVFQLLPDETELLRVGVVPGACRRGLARRLLEGSLARLALQGRPACHLEVRNDNRAARSLYESLGFRATGWRRRYYADGEDAVRYARDPRSPLG